MRTPGLHLRIDHRLHHLQITLQCGGLEGTLHESPLRTVLVKILEQQTARIKCAELLLIALFAGKKLFAILKNALVQISTGNQQSGLPHQAKA